MKKLLLSIAFVFAAFSCAVSKADTYDDLNQARIETELAYQRLLEERAAQIADERAEAARELALEQARAIAAQEARMRAEAIQQQEDFLEANRRFNQMRDQQNRN